MGNRTSYWPSLGETANQYNIPSEYARQKALNQQKLASTLQAQGRKGVWPIQELDKLDSWTLIPAAYHRNEEGETVTDAAIERDPAAYEHIFQKAQETLLHRELDYEDISDEERFCLYMCAIQDAIDTLLRPDQQHAETNMQSLTEEQLAQGEQVISIDQVKSCEAEVCTTKAMIAKHFLQTYCPWVESTMLSETAYAWGNDGHNYLSVTYKWMSYEYHANSPDAGGLPHLVWVSEQQRMTMKALLENQKQPPNSSAVIRTLQQQPKQRRMAA